MNEMNTKRCDTSCIFFGRASDAPETVEKDCMWQPSEENGWERPCDENGEEAQNE